MAAESALPWSRLDEVVDVELRACTYPYGGGQAGVGLQITLESRHLGQTIATRLPAEAARELALAILGGVDAGGCVCDLVDTSWAGGPPSYVRGRSNGCRVHPESPDFAEADRAAREAARRAT